MKPLPIIGVIGSSTDEHSCLAGELGQWLAHRHVHLLSGGGRGVMAAVSKAFMDMPNRTGIVLGILPCQPGDSRCRPKHGYPNPWVDIAIKTHLPLSGVQGTDPLSRNHLIVLSSDVIIALPGKAGTMSEMELALRYSRPIIAYRQENQTSGKIAPTIPTATTLKAVQDFVNDCLSTGNERK